MNEFYNYLYNPYYLKPIVRYWIYTISNRSHSLQDFLDFWFDSWGKHAATSFSLNWFNNNKVAHICLFDAKEKKLKKKKNMTSEEKAEALDEKNKAQLLQDNFYISKEFLVSNSIYKPFIDSFCELLEENAFTQNKLENKEFICLFKFKYNSSCDINKIIIIVFETLKEEFVLHRSPDEYILLEYYMFKYTKLYPYLHGLFTSHGIM
jgi:hypothetical protein